MLFCFTSTNILCKLSALKCFQRIQSKFLQFNKTCFIVKSSLQFIHCGALYSNTLGPVKFHLQVKP